MRVEKCLWLVLAGLLFVFSSNVFANDDNVILHWSFDDQKEIKFEYGGEIPEASTKEEITGTDAQIHGLTKYAPGVKGSALRFDGFTSHVISIPQGSEEEGEDESGEEESEEDEEEEEEDEGPPLPRAITVEAWVALGAYPWNWAPILTIGEYKITGFYFGVGPRGRVGFHMSDATSVWHECNSKVDPKTHVGLEIQKWHHVVGTYDPEVGMATYVNGELEGTYNDFTFKYGIVYNKLNEGFIIGKNRNDLAPSEPIRDWATYPSPYTFDGIIDEIKVRKGALSAEEVKAIYNKTKPKSDPEFDSRRFPTVKPSGRFGANYTRLKFYPEWDALWPNGEFMDVVVQFDELPTKVMFWRGTRYSACLVSENGKWMADQSRETGNNWFLGQGRREDMPTGCIEHMSDTQCRSSRVSIIESNDARCVVNWRYLQMDVKFRQKDVPNGARFGEWGNELYYIYPDGVTVRKVLPGYGGWQETIFLNEPGTRPEDNVELEACTLVNMAGESKTYSWEHGYPVFDLNDPVIQMTHFKSEYKPYMIFREGSGFDVFNLEVRPDFSHFPWWNHWPVAQTYSDGRSANASDRAAHSSLSWGDPVGNAALYGMSNQSPESLVKLARSWNTPPKAKLSGSAYENKGYDYEQRAYVIHTNKQNKPLKIHFDASEKSPLYNLALVVNNWGSSDPQLKIDGEKVKRGKDFRFGHEYDVEGNSNLMVWIRVDADSKTKIVLTPKK